MQTILKFKPIYKEKIWGGRKLASILNRNIPEGNIGESWELSDYGDDLSIVENGNLAGKNFRELYKTQKDEILGEVFKENEDFPLLVKIIDAKEKLSVQVHPDDEYANTKDPESSGKKEAWFILHSDPGAEIVCGFSENLTKEAYQEQVRNNLAENALQKFKAKPGDSFLITPGTVHAIGGGNLLLEVQQSSDSTYRVYDYGRLGDDGKPRKLHLEKALDVLNFQKSAGQELLQPGELTWEYGKRSLLNANDKFRLEVLEFSGKAEIPSMSVEKVFQIIYVIAGGLFFPKENISLKQGDTFLLTAEGMKNRPEFTSNEGVRLALMGVGSDWVRFA